MEAKQLQAMTGRKAACDAKLAELNSKAGADAFVAERLKKIDEDIPRCSESMAWQLGNVKKILKEKPTEYVDKIKSCLQAESLKLSASIAKNPVKGGKDG